MHSTELWKRLVIWGICLWGLLFALPNTFYTRVETHNDALTAVAEAGFATPAQAAARDGWPAWLPDSLVNLGLDLRGGAHLLAEVRLQDAHAARMDALWPDLRDALRALRDSAGAVRRLPAAPGELRVAIDRPEGMAEAVAAARALAQPVATLTGAGQPDLTVSAEDGTLVLRLTEAGARALDARTMDQSLEIIRRRIDEVGTREPAIQRQGDDRILIQVPGVGSAAEVKALIGATAQLTFHQVLGRADDTGLPPTTGRALPDATQKGLVWIVEDTPVVTGEQLTDAQPGFDRNGRPAVNFRFDPQGARRFGDFTAAHVGSALAIVLDGEVISAPEIQGAIPGGAGQITGQFTVDETTRLAVLLRAGSLPAAMDFLEERTIGPELGQDSIDAGLRAAVVGMVAVVGFMVACYGAFGLVATVALGLNMALLLGALSALGATLTLPGIAGIVLTMGMAVDANVLIFERIREELRQGRPWARAVEIGFDRALSAIVDANLTGLLTAAIMFWVGSGPVRGFAVTLGLGIVTSMFTAVWVSRSILRGWLAWRRPVAVTLKGWLRLAPERTAIDFFRWQRVTFGASVLAVAASVMLVATVGLNLGVDFRGGTTIRAETAQVQDIGAWRAALGALDMGDVAITQVFDPSFGPDRHVATIRIGAQGGDAAITPAGIATVEAALRAIDPGVTFPSVESVGPKVSAELVWLALAAVAAGALGILAYVWARFEWQFAVGTVAALVHDVVVTVGVFAALGLKFDLTIVAALLTILGYSVNDTVVIFDRLRENLAKYKAMPLRDLMNLSANETLGRTLMTAATTLIALLALFVLGGDVIRGFVFAMLFGVVVGTWSSLYVAKNIVLFLGLDRRDKAQRRPQHEFAQIDA